MINRGVLFFSLFLSVSPSLFTGHCAANDVEGTDSFEVHVDSIFNSPLSTDHNADLLWHEVKRHPANQWLPETHVYDLVLQADPVFYNKQP